MKESFVIADLFLFSKIKVIKPNYQIFQFPVDKIITIRIIKQINNIDIKLIIKASFAYIFPSNLFLFIVFKLIIEVINEITMNTIREPKNNTPKMIESPILPMSPISAI